MKQTVVPGASIEALTPDEAVALLRETYRETVDVRVRAPSSVALDATGSGQDEVFLIPSGFEFELRRVTFDLGAADPNTGAVALTGGKAVAYLRSGTRVEWAQPSYGAALQVPGAQTWGDQQGPYFRNAEVFEVRAVNLGAAVGPELVVLAEGLLRRPPPMPKDLT